MGDEAGEKGALPLVTVIRLEGNDGDDDEKTVAENGFCPRSKVGPSQLRERISTMRRWFSDLDSNQRTLAMQAIVVRSRRRRTNLYTTVDFG